MRCHFPSPVTCVLRTNNNVSVHTKDYIKLWYKNTHNPAHLGVVHVLLLALNVLIAMSVDDISGSWKVILYVDILRLGNWMHGHIVVVTWCAGWQGNICLPNLSFICNTCFNGIKCSSICLLDGGVGPDEGSTGASGSRRSRLVIKVVWSCWRAATRWVGGGRGTVNATV